MNLKKLGKALRFPPFAIMIILLSISTVFLTCSMVNLEAESVISVISYALAAYTLTVWCFKLPCLIRFFKNFREENAFARRWRTDERLRVNTSLFTSLILNSAYAALQLGLGFTHKSFWFYSLAAYYISLAVMRFFLVRHSARNMPREKMREELIKYCTCGWIFLVMNLTLSLMLFFMIYWDRTFIHSEITTIAMAAYTFTSLTLAILSIIKYRKYNSPVFSASKSISLASASVSLITLESTMLTTFGKETTDAFTRKLMLGLSGGAISVFVVIMAIYMIAEGTKKLKILTEKENKNGKQ